MSAPHLSDINLLPQDSFEASNIGRALHWVQMTGRVILVFTMLAVIIAYGSRFWFDKELNDLTDRINGKQTVIGSFSEIEAKMRDILLREGLVNDVLASDNGVGDIFRKLINACPADVSFTTIGMSEKGLSMTGSAKTETGFSGFLANMAKEPGFGKVTLGGTTFSQKEGEIMFSVSAVINRTETSK